MNTLLSSDNPNVYVEQFGDRFATVFNGSTKEQTVRLATLGDAKAAKELVCGGNWTFANGTASVTIPPETVRLLEFDR